MRISALLAALVLIGCKNGDSDTVGEDLDGDGYSAPDDCDDTDPDVRPGATEACNDVDDDCDGDVDENLRTDFFQDGDGDGFGADGSLLAACQRPGGYATIGGDCDDSDATAFPGNIEVCDNVDHDCDGDLTEGAAGNITFYLDSDGDGYGDPDETERDCSAPAGYVELTGDCDDQVDTVFPGAQELCNNVDDNCDALVDNGASDAQPFSYDADGDGYGIIGPTVLACSAGQSVDVDGDQIVDAVTVAPADATDCNDANSVIFPGAPEMCDGVDTDCNPNTDEDAVAVDVLTWYLDSDEDGAVDQTSSVTACSQPAGYGPDDADVDCNDDDPLISPYAPELCDTFDNDCDGATDENTAFDADAYYQDNDDDGFGDPTGPEIFSCSPIVGFVDNDFDCNDSSPAVGAPPPQYADVDEDGYGDPLVSDISCVPLLGYVDNADDCDDLNALLSPETLWFEDTDGDEYGTLVSVQVCEQPLGYTAASGDCDDTNGGVNPGATDVCNGLDDDCDQDVDEDCVVEHCGVIAANETWADDLIHLVTCDVRVQGTGSPTLTIADGADVRFQNDSQLIVGLNQPGTLVVAGGAQGVVMRSADLTNPQLWGGVLIGPRENVNSPSVIQGLTVQDAGFDGYGIKIDDVTAEIHDSTIVGSNGPGVLLEDDAILRMTNTEVIDNNGVGVSGGARSRVVEFTGNTLTGNLGEPIVLAAPSAGVVDDSSTYSPNGRDEIGILGGTVATDLTLEPLAAPYRILGTVTVEAAASPTLTLLDGTEIRYAASAELRIGRSQPGTLLVQGTSAGVTMRSADLAVPTRWGGITIGPRADVTDVSSLVGLTVLDAGSIGFGIKVDDVAADFTGVTVDGADGAGLLLEDDAIVQVTGSAFTNNSGAGIRGVATASIPTFTGNTLTGNLAEPMFIPATALGVLDGTSTFAPNGVAPIAVFGGTLASNTTMRRLDAPYRMDGDLIVQGAAAPVLTVNDGVEVRFAGDAQLRIGASNPGTLIVNGTTDGVLMRSSNLVTPNAWGGVVIGPRQNAGLPSSLTGLTVQDPGADGFGVRVDDVTVAFDDVTVSGSAGTGILLANDAIVSIANSSIIDNAGVGVLGTALSRISAFTNNTLTGNQSEPIILAVTSVGALDSGSTYLPNGIPLVGLLGGTVSSNTTMAALNAPYRVDGDITVQGANSPVLTIANGAELRFSGSSQLRVGIQQVGTLIATGTLMQSVNVASPTPWGGLVVGPNANPSNPSTLTGVTVRNAGADGFGVLVDDVELRITGSTIQDSDGPGIELEDDARLQLVTSNVLGNNGVGVQSNPNSRITMFIGNTLTGNDDEPLIIDAPSIGALNATSTFTPNGTDFIGVLGGTIPNSATLAEVDADYRIDGDLVVSGGSAPQLTVQDGVRAEFSAGTGLTVGAAAQGALVVEGDTTGVVFTGTANAPGHWDGVTIGVNANPSDLRGLALSYGGGNGRGNLLLQAAAATDPDERALMQLTGVTSTNSSFSGLYAERVKLAITGSTFSNNLEYGAQILDVVFSDSSIDGSTFATNAKSGVQVSPHLVELLVGTPANSFVTNVFPIEIIAGTVPDSALWQPLEEDYYVVGVVNVQFQDESVLTIAEGTTIYFGPTGRLRMGANFQGSLIVDGTPADPVVMDAITAYQGLPTPRGSYPGLYFGNFQRTSRLDNLIIRNAGSTADGSIYIQGTHPNPVELDEVLVEDSGADGVRVSASTVWIHDSIIQDGDDLGVNLINAGRLVNLGPGTRSFTNNVIVGNALDPIHLLADNAGQLDPSSSFTGNNLITSLPDRIRITGDVTRSQTWVVLGLPYWAQTEILVGAASAPTLTIDPGVIVQFRAGTDDRMYVGPLGEDGGILAVGTALEPVVFTSDEDYVGGDPQHGDWGGVELGPDCIGLATNQGFCVLDFVNVDYGGSLQEEAALMVATRRSIPFLTQAVIQNVRQRYSGSSGLQFQAENGVVAPTPLPNLPVPYQEDLTQPYGFACEDFDLNGVCDNFDYCYSGSNHGTNNLFCDNVESNVTARNFQNPFSWLDCNLAGLDDGPEFCP